jgi:hypothetical protein
MVSIGTEDALFRRVCRLCINPDGTVNSAAFKLNSKPDPQPSVDLARLTTPQESLDRAPRADFRLGRLIAGSLHPLDMKARWAPVPDNQAHCVIDGENTKVKCRQLASLTVLIDGLFHRDYGRSEPP